MSLRELLAKIDALCAALDTTAALIVGPDKLEWYDVGSLSELETKLKEDGVVFTISRPSTFMERWETEILPHFMPADCALLHHYDDGQRNLYWVYRTPDGYTVLHIDDSWGGRYVTFEIKRTTGETAKLFKTLYDLNPSMAASMRTEDLVVVCGVFIGGGACTFYNAGPGTICVLMEHFYHYCERVNMRETNRGLPFNTDPFNRDRRNPDIKLDYFLHADAGVMTPANLRNVIEESSEFDDVYTVRTAPVYFTTHFNSRAYTIRVWKYECQARFAHVPSPYYQVRVTASRCPGG
jgi:hypothetical protein